MSKRLLHTLALAALVWTLAGATLPARARPGYATVARVTHYWATGSRMADGEWPYVGAVACSEDLPLYSWVGTPDGAWWQCLDRGALYGSTWIDFYGFAAEAVYGSWTTIATAD